MIELLNYDFMIRAIIAGLAIGVLAPMIGTFLVVRRYSLMASTLAHVSLAGVAIGLLTQTSPVIMTVIASVIAAVGIERLRETKKVMGESSMALFMSTGTAVATILISIARGFSVELFSFLFGSITTVSQSDVLIIVALGLVIVAIVITLFKELFFISFDEELARANGMNVSGLNYLFMVLTGVSIALSIRIVGALLIEALMIIPVLSAFQLKKSFRESFVWAIIFSLFSVSVGMVFSYYLDIAAGGTIVITALILFIVTSLLP
jgi:zinc transport system permease protein